jgi:SHS2 domain-containing protein
MTGGVPPGRSGTFAHDADIGVVGRGATIEAAFVAAAEAMFGIMVDITAVRPLQSVQVAFEEADCELALVRWLNGLLGEARVASLALGRFGLRREGNRWMGEGWGEPWSDTHDRGVEVKGATLTMLAVAEGREGWYARCIVDV